MTTPATNHPTALRRALLLDAAASGTMGVLLLLAAGPVAQPLGLPVSLLRWAGVTIVPFAALLVWVARRANLPRDLVRTIVGANALWVIGSVLLLASGWVRPTALGELFVLLQAAAVAGFAYLEYRGLRRDNARLRSAPATTGRFGEEHGR